MSTITLSSIVSDKFGVLIVEKDGAKFNLSDPWYIEEYKHGKVCEVCGDKGAAIAMLHQNCQNTLNRRPLTINEKRRKEWDSKSKGIGNKVYARDGHMCCRCGNTNQSDLSIDHIVPLSKGGSNDLSNLQVMCKRCNSSKGAR